MPNGLRYLALFLVVLGLDQASKLAVEQYLNYRQVVPIIPGLNLTLAYNHGAAFSFLAGAGGWQRWFFVALTLVVAGVILWLMFQLQKHERLAGYGYSLVLAGAVGNNLIDRVFYGHVIDFIDVYYQNHHWPAFNIADSAICLGAVLLILLTGRAKPTPADKI